MKFEHLVEINNPRDSLVTPITRVQLWRGLVLRAEQPTLFMPQLDTCDILSRSHNTLSRRLRFGNLTVHDHVWYDTPKQIRFVVPAQEEIAESFLTVTIEEPFPNQLFVRFSYQDASPEEGPESRYNDYRRSAYHAADLDTISTIRQMVRNGLFKAALPDNERIAD
ncbi:MAG: DUF1857 family protein [Burkholderiaceae bacterium]|jgi:hypothetical protein|nr:DUF1857 family protein [Burkholderiaceae bacterium]